MRSVALCVSGEESWRHMALMAPNDTDGLENNSIQMTYVINRI